MNDEARVTKSLWLRVAFFGFVSPLALLAQAPTEGEPEPEPKVVYEVPQLPEQIEDPSAVPPYVLLIVFGAIGAILLLGLVLIGFVLLRRRLMKAPPPVALPPPIVEAMRRLKSLLAGLEEREPVEVAREVSDVLKRYTDRRFGVAFQKETTEEIQATAPSWTQQLPKALAAAIVPYLERCDMIKFKGSSEIEMEKKQLMDEAKALIESAEESARRAEARAKKA